MDRAGGCGALGVERVLEPPAAGQPGVREPIPEGRADAEAAAAIPDFVDQQQPGGGPGDDPEPRRWCHLRLAGQARIRGDLPQADLVHIAELTTVVAGQPQVAPPAGFRVIASLPSRLPLIHEIRYASADLGVGPALGDGLTYTGLTSGGGFEDALYAEGATPAGTVHGAAAVLSSVQGGNGTLAWEPSPGVVAYVGWSGGPVNAEIVTALRTLAEGTYILTPRQWLAAKPQLADQENNPAN